MQAKPIKNETYTHEELLSMSFTEATDELTEKQKKFCEYYVEGHNRLTACIKAGYETSQVKANYSGRLLRLSKVQRYIQWLKARAVNQTIINAVDILDAWIRIAFSDMTDFVDIRPTHITLKPADKIDGQLIKSIKSGRDGISVELHDKMKALDNLAKYVDDMPHEWKQKLDERRQELLEQEFELKKKMYELETPEQEEDGFIEAIKESAKYIWEGEENDI